MSGRSTRRRAKLAAVLLVAAIAAACFGSRPVRQEIEVVFHEDGSAEVAVTTRIKADAYDDSNPELLGRVSRLSGRTLRTEDSWSRGIRLAAPDKERRTYEFDKGHLIQAVQEALVNNPRAFPQIWSEIPVGVFMDVEGPRMTLEIETSGSGRASERQERKVHESLDAFSRNLAAYLKPLAALYEYIDGRPERAGPCMAKLFGVSPEEANVDPNLSEKEVALVDAVDKATDPLLNILSVPDGEAYTLDELSQLVFDPFPGSVDIQVEGRVLESEGFLEDEDGHYLIPEYGLWSSVEALEDRWVTPLPVVALVEEVQDAEDSGEEGDAASFLEDYLGQPRAVRSVPNQKEVREALEDELTPAPSYRLRWILPVPKDSEESYSAE